VREALEAPTAREVAKRVLAGSIELVANPKNPGGCLAVQAALACGDEGARAQKTLAGVRAASQDLLEQRFERAKAERDLPAGSSPADLARYVVTVMHGISVQGAGGGASKRDLKLVADLAMRAWPGGGRRRRG
jgi:hypothetical protein